MNPNIIESLIDSQASAYSDQHAADSVRRRVRNRRVRNASLSGIGAVAAVGAIAYAGTQVTPWGGGFRPASWAPAPNPYLPDAAGDGQARVPLPTPPQPVLPTLSDQAVVDDLIMCPAFAPKPTTSQGHAIVSLSQVVPLAQAPYEVDVVNGAWEPRDIDGLGVGLSTYEISSTTGAATSIRVSQSRLYFVRDGVVVEVWTSWDTGFPTSLEVNSNDTDYVATAGRFLAPLGGEHPTQVDSDFYLGSWHCGAMASDGAGPNLENGSEYQVYLEVRVVADEQSAAQRHLLDEGVDLDTVTGENGTIVDFIAQSADTGYEAIDVTFPAEYLQDQFDEVLVSEPLTIRIPDSWNTAN